MCSFLKMDGGWRMEYGRSRRPESVREFGMYTIYPDTLALDIQRVFDIWGSHSWLIEDCQMFHRRDMAIWWAGQCWVRCGSFVRGQRPFVTGVFITAQCLNTNFLSPPLFVTIDLFALLTFFYCGSQVQEAPHIYKGWGQKPQLRESWLGVGGWVSNITVRHWHCLLTQPLLHIIFVLR